MPKKVALLSSELLTAAEIYKEIKVDGEPVYFSKLVEKLSKEPKKLSRGAISRALERLHDFQIIKTDWIKINNTWVRSIVIKGESEEFIKGIYEQFLKE